MSPRYITFKEPRKNRFPEQPQPDGLAAPAPDAQPSQALADGADDGAAPDPAGLQETPPAQA